MPSSSKCAVLVHFLALSPNPSPKPASLPFISVKVLRGEDQGVVVEFVNPKYKAGDRTEFKKPTRLECMMQDFPKLMSKELGDSTKVWGCRWMLPVVDGVGVWVRRLLSRLLCRHVSTVALCRCIHRFPYFSELFRSVSPPSRSGSPFLRRRMISSRRRVWRRTECLLAQRRARNQTSTPRPFDDSNRFKPFMMNRHPLRRRTFLKANTASLHPIIIRNATRGNINLLSPVSARFSINQQMVCRTNRNRHGFLLLFAFFCCSCTFLLHVLNKKYLGRHDPAD